MWYPLYGETESRSVVFEERMVALCRELGERGKQAGTGGGADFVPATHNAQRTCEPKTSEQSTTLRAKLAVLKLKDLRQRVVALGATEDEVEDAEERENVKGALLDLAEDLHKTRSATKVAPQAESLKASQLTSWKLRDLRKRATELGATEEDIESAEESANVKLAMIDLVAAMSAQIPNVEHLVEDVGIIALQDELKGLKFSSLHKRAAAQILDAEQLEAALDSDDPKGQLIALIIESHVAVVGTAAIAAASANTSAQSDSSEDELLIECTSQVDGSGPELEPELESEPAPAVWIALRDELKVLRPMALLRRAAIEGVGEEQRGAAMSSDDPKAQLIALILESKRASA
eukprot:SAG11_NODE_252_length_11593_cov_7.436663_6_plen_349_part_00